MTITKASSTDAGCWIDGHWGQYGVARMIEIAAEHGYVNPDIAQLANAKMFECAHPGACLLTDSEDETLEDVCDSVVDWLNENVTPEGCSFNWFEGEFFLNSHEDWLEAYGEVDERTEGYDESGEGYCT